MRLHKVNHIYASGGGLLVASVNVPHLFSAADFSKEGAMRRRRREGGGYVVDRGGDWAIYPQKSVWVFVPKMISLSAF